MRFVSSWLLSVSHNRVLPSGRPDPIEQKRQPRLHLAVDHLDSGARRVLPARLFELGVAAYYRVR